ncbi:MAG: ankyrin repeat-containing protein [Chthonomonadaceae bacterium]|nr:ankyrin repeat-containing protein [Chthonomonadaceae bacterium]
MKKRRALIISLLVLMLLVCIASGLVLLGYRRVQASRELILAIKANDTNRALDALRAHADPNTRDQDDAVPSLRDYLSKLWQQMRGINPSLTSVGQTALTLAVTHNNTVVAEALLDRGARDVGEVMRVTSYGRNESLPLVMAATSYSNPALVRALVKHGSNVNVRDKDFSTALCVAEDAATIKTLVTCGADLNARDLNGDTVLDCSLQQSSPLVDVLLDEGAYDSKAFAQAAEYDNVPALNRMLRMGWKFDMPDEEGRSPLMRAAEPHNAFVNKGDLNAALLLMRIGANVNAQDRRGDTPLLLAVIGGWEQKMDRHSPDVVRALLKQGARIDAQDELGMTPLMVAASFSHPVLVRILLEHGARVNMRTKKGETALALAQDRDYRATDNGSRSEVIRLLKNAGAKE